MIQLDWDVAQENVIRYTFLHPWTWEEYYAMDPQRNAMFSTTNQMIDIILDFTGSKRIPIGVMTHFPKVASWDNLQRGIVIVIGVDRMLQLLADIMVSVYPQAMSKAPRPAQDLADARRIIEEVRRKRAKDRSLL